MVFHKGCGIVHFAFGAGCEGISRDLEMGSVFVVGLLQEYGSHCMSLREARRTLIFAFVRPSTFSCSRVTPSRTTTVGAHPDKGTCFGTPSPILGSKG